jgi:hypothetical protein
VELGSGSSPENDQEKDSLRDQVQDLHGRASTEELQYLIKSDKTDHMAMHK